MALRSDRSNVRPALVDFSVSTWNDASPHRTGNRRRPVAGAIRLSLEPGVERHRQLLKVSAGLMFAVAGVLMATASNGTVDRRPALPVAVAAIQPPAFFFGDEHDALADTAGALAPAALPGAARANGVPASTDAAASPPSAPVRGGDPVPIVDHPSLIAARERATTPRDTSTTRVVIAAGDTLSGILHRHGVKADRMNLLLGDEVVVQHLSSLRIGQQLTLTHHADGRFHSLATRLGNERKIIIRQTGDELAVAAIDLPVEKERVVSSGTIEQSLYLAAAQANLRQSTIMELADIFQWELDFARDIRAGDQFSVVYDRLYREGRYIGDGDILAAEFIRGGKHHEAIRFTTDDGVSGYYSPDGRSKRRTFSRHPVDVVRVTSHFDPNRMHPVLHQIRAHRGVDYGAPHGSPIRATADGTIRHSGPKGAYGNTVVIGHGQKIETLYAHMSAIAPAAASGKRVGQGDIIGYVGRTGRVTGTHLHYEFRRSGKHVDPLKVELPAAEPLAPRYRDELRAVSEQMIAQMRSVLPDGEPAIGERQLASIGQ